MVKNHEEMCVCVWADLCVNVYVYEHTNVCKCVWVFAIWTFQAERITAGRENKTGTFDWANIDKVEGEAGPSLGQDPKKEKEKKNRSLKKLKEQTNRGKNDSMLCYLKLSNKKAKTSCKHTILKTGNKEYVKS